MQHGGEFRQAAPGLDQAQEFALVQVVGDRAADQVAELGRVGLQVVHHQDVGHAAGVQRPHQIAADKAGAAGYHVHAQSSCASSAATSCAVAVAVPSLPTTMPAARFARCTAAASPRSGGQRQRQRRHHRVAGAGHVEHLARPRRVVQGRGAGAKQGHALLAARDQQPFDAQPGQPVGGLGVQLILAVPGPGHGGELAAIGRQQAGAGVAGVVVALGVDDHRPAAARAPARSVRRPPPSVPLP